MLTSCWKTNLQWTRFSSFTKPNHVFSQKHISYNINIEKCWEWLYIWLLWFKIGQNIWQTKQWQHRPTSPCHHVSIFDYCYSTYIILTTWFHFTNAILWKSEYSFYLNKNNFFMSGMDLSNITILKLWCFYCWC